MRAHDQYFVSYNHKDQEWAEWVAWTIEDLGYRAVIQAWDFVPGRSWVHEMQLQLAACTAVICLLSQNFLESDYTAAEWETAFAKDPVGKHRRLIPIRIKECELHAFLNTRVYVDFVGRERDICRELVRKALTGERAKPSSEPTFPGDKGQEPAFPGRMQRFALVLDGVFEEYDRRRVEALTEHLRKILKDSNLSILDVRAGTVIISIEARPEALEVLEQLRSTPEGIRFLGDPAIAHWKLAPNKEIDPVGERLVSYGEWLQEMFEPQVGMEAAQDLVQDFVVLVLTAGNNRYPILESPALAAQVARGLLMDYLKQRDEENIARRAVNLRSPELPDRDEILRLSMRLFEQLSEYERDLLENYWNARFEGSDLADEIESESRSLDEDIRLRQRYRMFGEEEEGAE